MPRIFLVQENELSDAFITVVIYRPEETSCAGNELGLSNIVSLANTTSSKAQFELGWVQQFLALSTVEFFRECSIISSSSNQNSTVDKHLQQASVGLGL